MQRTTYRSLVYYQFQSLTLHGDLAHGIFTRLGGYSQPPFAALNTGHTVGDDPEAVRANHRLIYEALGVGADDVVSPYQVHGTTVRAVEERDKGQILYGTDALVTATPGVYLMLRFADCVPVMFYDPVRHAAGLAHAGWRGTVAGVARVAVQAMVDAFGCRLADIRCGIGPAIGPCCYEVGDNVTAAVRQMFPDAADRFLLAQGNGRFHLDLWAANRRQLAKAGVRCVDTAGICTACHTDEWYSYRAEEGKTGRIGALIGLRA
jgi:YfiH family protein